MKRAIKLITLAVVAILFTACSHDDIPPASVSGTITDTPIDFYVGVAEPTSRAGYPAGELTEGAMGFCMQTAGTDALEQNTKEKYNGVNRKVECIDGNWMVDGSPLLWRNATNEVTWQAYYPYSENNVTDGILTITIPTDQNKDGVYDLLYGKGSTTGAASVNGINVELKHMLSKFMVNLNLGTELSDIGVESVVLTGMQQKTYLNLLTGSFVGNLGMPAPINMLKHADGKTFEAIVLPYAPGSIGLEITLDDGKKFYYKQGSTIFDSGINHTLDLKVGKDIVETKAMKTAGWPVE